MFMVCEGSDWCVCVCDFIPYYLLPLLQPSSHTSSPPTPPSFPPHTPPPLPPPPSHTSSLPPSHTSPSSSHTSSLPPHTPSFPPHTPPPPLTHLLPPPHTQLYLKSRRCCQTSVIRTISSLQSLQTGVSVVASTLMYSRPFAPPWQSGQQTPPPTLCALEIKSARFCNASFAKTFCLASLKLGRSRQCLQRLLSLHDRSLARGWSLRVQRLCTTSSRTSYRTGRHHSL